MSKDTRTPTSVHFCGKVKVLIYDEEAYRAHLAEYYPGDISTPAHTSRRYTPKTYEKRKPAGRYNWTGRKLIPYKREEA